MFTKLNCQDFISLSAEKLKYQQFRLMEKIYREADKFGLQDYVVADGVVDVEGYLNKRPRICFLGCNPGNGNDQEGGYSTMDMVNGKLPVSYHVYAYIATCINRWCSYMSLDYIRDDKGIQESLRDTLILNVDKTVGKISDVGGMWLEILEEQLITFQPEIIICSGSFRFVRDILLLEEEEIDCAARYIRKVKACTLYRTPRWKIIDCVNLNGRIFERSELVDLLVDIID